MFGHLVALASCQAHVCHINCIHTEKNRLLDPWIYHFVLMFWCLVFDCFDCFDCLIVWDDGDDIIQNVVSCLRQTMVVESTGGTSLDKERHNITSA
jgi:hypothetical protein